MLDIEKNICYNIGVIRVATNARKFESMKKYVNWNGQKFEVDDFVVVSLGNARITCKVVERDYIRNTEFGTKSGICLGFDDNYNYSVWYSYRCLNFVVTDLDMHD